MDAWWLGDSGAPSKVGQDQMPSWHRRGSVLALLALDRDRGVLFFRQAVGLSLAIFAGAVFLAVLTTLPTRARLYPSLLMLLSVLPVIDYVQPCHWAFWLSG
jgi:hypothetical protein